MKYSLLLYYLSVIAGYPVSSTNRISGIQHKPDIRYPALNSCRISGKITIRHIPNIWYITYIHGISYISYMAYFIYGILQNGILHIWYITYMVYYVYVIFHILYISYMVYFMSIFSILHIHYYYEIGDVQDCYLGITIYYVPKL